MSQEPSTDLLGGRSLVHAVRFLLYAAFVYLYVINFWLNDDAYITFRTVDNFVNGYGLRWNVCERVLVNVHPLWMFLMSGLYLFSGNIYVTALLASFSLSSLTLFLVWSRSREAAATAALTLLMLSSTAFMDFTSSGLENPLSYFLGTLFFVRFLHRPASFEKGRTVFFFYALASLNFLARYDTILFFVPALLHVAAGYGRKHRRPPVLPVLAGILPAVSWLVFSIIYYGFVFPNVYHAKLNTLATGADKIAQGLRYVQHCAVHDPITLITVLLGLICGFSTRETRPRLAAAGIAAYLLYVVAVGGTFMTGRFLAVPFLFSVLLVQLRVRFRWKQALPACLLLVLYAALMPRTPLWACKNAREPRDVVFAAYRLADDHCFYHATCNLLRYLEGTEPFPDHDWAKLGMQLREASSGAMVHLNVGYLGFFAGPDRTIIDLNALTDPLLSHLPGQSTFLAGHNSRLAPAGYPRSQEEGRNLIADDALRDYYEKIRIVTRGKLFTLRRWQCIYDLNVGGSRRYSGAYEPDRSSDNVVKFHTIVERFRKGPPEMLEKR